MDVTDQASDSPDYKPIEAGVHKYFKHNASSAFAESSSNILDHLFVLKDENELGITEQTDRYLAESCYEIISLALIWQVSNRVLKRE